jgi:hypothetical protein
MASARERTQLRGLRHQDYDQDETLLRWSSRTGTYIRDCVILVDAGTVDCVAWLVPK